jgi:hypothetical protein
MAVALSLAASVFLSSALAQAPAPKPNILFIMGDDIGWMAGAGKLQPHASDGQINAPPAGTHRTSSTT